MTNIKRRIEKMKEQWAIVYKEEDIAQLDVWEYIV